MLTLTRTHLYAIYALLYTLSSLSFLTERMHALLEVLLGWHLRVGLSPVVEGVHPVELLLHRHTKQVGPAIFRGRGDDRQLDR